MNYSLNKSVHFFLQAFSSRAALVLAAVLFSTLGGVYSLLEGADFRAALENALLTLTGTAATLHYLHIRWLLSKQKKQVHNAQLDSLQAHIRPHFLFNSMNIIASLIQSDPDKAEQTVEDLSDLFRSSLRKNNVITSMDQELHLCRSYLRIEQNRLGSRLQTLWRIGAYPKDLTIPAFTIQPLVENAVYHGIQPLELGGLVEVAVSVEKKKVQILVENPMPLSGGISKGNQIALTNIRSRLAMLYGKEACLTTEIQDNGSTRRFIARVVYPQDSRNEARFLP